MKPRTLLIITAIVLLLIEAAIWKSTATAQDVSAAAITAAVAADTKPRTAEHVTPAYTAEQAQASALAVPAPAAAPPASLVVVTVCNQIVGIVAADTEGNLHPLNIEGLGDGRLKSILARVPQKVVVDTGCAAEPNRQPIF